MGRPSPTPPIDKTPPQPLNGPKYPVSAAADGTGAPSTLSKHSTTSSKIVSGSISPPMELEQGVPYTVECPQQQVKKSTDSVSLQNVNPVFNHEKGKKGAWSVLLQKVDSVLLLEEKERSKQIVKHSWPLFLMRCLVHFVPIAASIALIVLNLRGYFIGHSFQGSTNISPSVHVFFLQVAAKLMELLIVASISMIVLDIIRYDLLEGEDGLPFGLLGSATAFRGFSFLWSTNLWYGTGAISPWLRKLRLPAFLILSCLLATVAGPSSALLMIPLTRDFPAGGSDFWLIGSEASLWPLNLNAKAVGGESCLNATLEMMQLKTENHSGCIWSSTSAITEVAKSLWMTPLVNTMTVVDGSLRREVSFRASSLSQNYYDTWALSSSYAVVASSTMLSWIWYDALYHAPIAEGKTSIPSRLKYRTQELSVAKVRTQLPIVRVKCNNTVDLPFGTRTQLIFPLFAYYSNRQEQNGSHYDMEVSQVNSSSILTQWIPLPQSQSKNSGPQGSYPSTFLAIQVPQNAVNATVYTCSIDARWVEGDATLSNVAQDSPLQAAVVTSQFVPDTYVLPRYLPIDDGTWRQVSVDLDWLYALTPFLNNSAIPSPPQTRDQPGRTSLSAMLATAGFDNSTSVISEGGWGDKIPNLESVIAILVAEGMARVGQADKSVYIRARTDDMITPVYNSILKGSSDPIYNPLYVDASNGTRMHWSVAVTGYAYRADGVAYYLSVGVLLIHAIMALLHIAHGFRKGTTLEAWSSFEELMALSHNSKPNPEAMMNTSAGIESGATLKRNVRIRVKKEVKGERGEEQVQLLFSPNEENPNEEDYKKVEGNIEYSVINN